MQSVQASPTPVTRPDQKPEGVRRRASLEISKTGFLYCAMMILVGLAAINNEANLLFGVFGLMVGILLVSGAVSRRVIRRLVVRRILPDHGVVGQPMTLIHEVRNAQRFWPSFSVTVTELDGAEAFERPPQSYMLHAPPGAATAVSAVVTPKRRGLHRLDRFQISTSFPFGFIKRAVNHRHAEALLIYPPLAQVDRRLLAQCRGVEHIGATARPRPGGNEEFYGVREFRPGDNPRLIYWRRSARAGPGGALVAREHTRVAPPRLLLLVDTFSGPLAARSIERLARIERSIAMAGSMAVRALEEDLPVGLLAWSGGWKVIEPARGKRHLNDLLGVLARLQTNSERPASELIAHSARCLKSGASSLLFTPDDRPAGADERAATPLIVIPAASAAADAWFKFAPTVDFTTVMPG